MAYLTCAELIVKRNYFSVYLKDILSQIFGDDLSDDTKDEKAGDSLFADSAAEEEITEEAPAEELSVEPKDILYLG